MALSSQQTFLVMKEKNKTLYDRENFIRFNNKEPFYFSECFLLPLKEFYTETKPFGFSRAVFYILSSCKIKNDRQAKKLMLFSG